MPTTSAAVSLRAVKKASAVCPGTRETSLVMGLNSQPRASLVAAVKRMRMGACSVTGTMVEAANLCPGVVMGVPSIPVVEQMSLYRGTAA